MGFYIQNLFGSSKEVPPFKAAVPDPLGTGDRCSYENLVSDDLGWSRGGDAGARERLQIQMRLHSLAGHSPPAV